jgi:hypothetical protein
VPDKCCIASRGRPAFSSHLSSGTRKLEIHIEGYQTAQSVTFRIVSGLPSCYPSLVDDFHEKDARPGFHQFGLSGAWLHSDAALGIDVHNRHVYLSRICSRCSIATASFALPIA